MKTRMHISTILAALLLCVSLWGCSETQQADMGWMQDEPGRDEGFDPWPEPDPVAIIQLTRLPYLRIIIIPDLQFSDDTLIVHGENGQLSELELDEQGVFAGEIQASDGEQLYLTLPHELNENADDSPTIVTIEPSEEQLQPNQTMSLLLSHL